MSASYDGQLRNPVAGLISATVVENFHEEHPGMIKVNMYMQADGHGTTDWVRVMMPYAGSGYGSYTLPEIGDEVIVGFLNGDMRLPIVIGSVWNEDSPLMGETAVDKNNIKRFLSRAGNDVTVSDEDGKEYITVKTKKGFAVKLEDEPEQLTITDPDGKNLMVLDAKEGKISLTADKKIELKAGSVTVTLDGQGDKLAMEAGTVDINAKQTFKTKGMTTEISGSQVTVKADATLNAQSSGVTNVKGSMVKIN